MYRVTECWDRARDFSLVLGERVAVLHSELFKLPLLQVEHGLVQATFIHGAKISTRRFHQLEALVEEILNESLIFY